MNSEKPLIPPKAAAAAMMKMTMTYIENQWNRLKPSLAAYTKEASLSAEQEDYIIHELYLAALSFEIITLPLAADKQAAEHIEKGMLEIMASEEFASLALADSIYQTCIPAIKENVKADYENPQALIEAGAAMLYQRLPLALKTGDMKTSMLWAKLLQFLPLITGKWPILFSEFPVSDG